MTIEGAPLKIVRLYHEGVTITEIAERFAIEPDRVCRIINTAARREMAQRDADDAICRATCGAGSRPFSLHRETCPNSVRRDPRAITLADCSGEATP